MPSSSEEEEEEEGYDGFSMEAFDAPPGRSPNRTLGSMRGTMSEVGTSGHTLGGSPPPPPKGSMRRGSIVQVGGRATALSQSAELAVTLRRLKAANETGDANVMQAALTAAGAAALMEGPEAQELQMLAMAMASRLAEDTGLAKTGQLRRSGEVRARVRRLWDLMVAETTAMRQQSGMMRPGETAQDVTLEAYRNMHMRVAKVLAMNDEFDEEEALKVADQDWAEDISRFSGTSHITVWLDEIRTKFKEASARAVAEHSFRELFRTFDADGNGELDGDEFREAVREKLKITEDIISAEEVEELFKAVDADGSGEIDSSEFVTWLFPPALARTPKGKKGGKKKSTAALVRTQSEAALKDRFRDASARMSQTVGWELIFKKYDDDESGELEIDEFTRAVREECQLSEDAVPDEEIEELFGVIDADQSGAIDSDELGDLLSADLGAGSMTFGPFYSSIFELASVWMPVERESSYVRFLEGLFDAITEAVNGHELDLDTGALPVFDDEDNLVPNFRLKALERCMSLVADDGNLNIDDLQSVNAQDILPENNPMSPAYIENKQAKGRERRKSLSATISNSSLTSPRARTGSNVELPTPSPQERELPALAEVEMVDEDEEEPEPEQQPPPPSPESDAGEDFTCVRSCDIRAEFDVDSAVVGKMDEGTTVKVIETRRNAAGVLQVRCAQGWIGVHDEMMIVCLERTDELEAKRRREAAAAAGRKKVTPRPPPRKLGLLNEMSSMMKSSDIEKFGEGGWRRLASPVSPRGEGSKSFADAKPVVDQRTNVASHWTYGAAPPQQLRPAAEKLAAPAGGVGGGGGGRPKELPAVRVHAVHSSAAGALSARGVAKGSVLSSDGGGTGRRKKSSKKRPSIQIDAIVGTGPLSGRGHLQHGGRVYARMPVPPPGSRLISPRTLGAAGFRFAPSKTSAAGVGAATFEEEFQQRSSTSGSRAQTAAAAATAGSSGSQRGGLSSGGSWMSPFERIGGRMVPPVAPMAAIPNRPHTGHCIQPHAMAGSGGGGLGAPDAMRPVLLRPAVVPVDGGAARELLGYGENPLYLHMLPGETLGTPRSSRGSRSHGATSLRAPLVSPGKPHRGVPHNQFDLPTIDLADAANVGKELPALAEPKAGSWGRLPPGETPLQGVATR
jgi:Ca2+-binding EF-hand superfamily protein